MKILLALGLLLCTAATITATVLSSLTVNTGSQNVIGELVVINGNYYFLSSTSTSHAEAIQTCNGIQMKLISIQNEEKQQAIADFLNNNGYGTYLYWTSGIRLTDVLYMWSSTGQLFTYTNWNVTEPNEQDSTRDVFVILNTAYYDRKWVDIDANSRNYTFICEPMNMFN